MYRLKGSLEAKLQERLPFNVRKIKYQQFKGWKPVLCFRTSAKYRLLTCMAHASTLLTKFDVLWVGCWYGWEESNKFINLYSEWSMKISAWALFERKQGRTASSWVWIPKILSFTILEKQSNTSGYLFSSCGKVDQPFLSFFTNIQKWVIFIPIELFWHSGPQAGHTQLPVS